MNTLNRNNLPFVLLVLDGLGLNPNTEANAVYHAKTPTLDKLNEQAPKSSLITHGERVGLPEGQMGNSEVGHLNIGAGRVVMQDLSRIGKAVEENKISQIDSLKKVSAETNALHFIGLLSQGGVHSDEKHLRALIEAALELGAKRIYIHAITDGRDRPPKNATSEIAEFEKFISSLNAEVEIASVIGRYYAMDRDKRWERTEEAYHLFFEGKAELSDTSIQAALEKQYQADTTDEFIRAVKLDSKFSDRPSHIQAGDGLVFYNFRADRMRQIVSVTLGEVTEFPLSHDPKQLQLATLTSYDDDYDIDVLFPPLTVEDHLGEVLANSGLRQLRIAETEKYPHVTYFFNGGEEVPSERETREMVPSPRDVATYDLKPEMSVYGVTDKLISALKGGEIDVAIVNFANCDMVGHTGVFEAAVKAVESVDDCLGKLLDCLDEVGGAALITADHGNSEQMVDYETGEPHTFHTTYPVPIYYFGPDESVELSQGGALCDIAPTILELLGLPKSDKMTGSSLLKRAS